ncbi:MAG: hypothetical protein FD167_5686 [bacterium]|nr:MAG: hypothetical protein FD167_5686 [bacterium]
MSEIDPEYATTINELYDLINKLTHQVVLLEIANNQLKNELEFAQKEYKQDVIHLHERIAELMEGNKKQAQLKYIAKRKQIDEETKQRTAKVLADTKSEKLERETKYKEDRQKRLAPFIKMIESSGYRFKGDFDALDRFLIKGLPKKLSKQEFQRGINLLFEKTTNPNDPSAQSEDSWLDGLEDFINQYNNQYNQSNGK